MHLRLLVKAAAGCMPARGSLDKAPAGPKLTQANPGQGLTTRVT